MLFRSFLASIAPEADAFRAMQQRAFREERERWAANGLLEVSAPPEMPDLDDGDGVVAEGCVAVTSPMTASVFQIAVEPGERVAAGARLVVLDAMKTEIVIASSAAGVVEEIRCAPGKLVHAGQTLVVLRTE